MARRDEPPEQRPPGEPIRCRHCGATFEEDEDGVDLGDHQDGCPEKQAEEQRVDPPEELMEGDPMIIPERDDDVGS